MRVYLVYRKEDADFGETLAREMAKKQFEAVEDPKVADLALLLVSRGALERGLGDHARRAMEQGLRTLTVLLGDDAVPMRFPVPRKHVDLVKDVAGVLKILADYRKNMSAKIIDSKSDLFGYGVLLGLVHRGS
jgi:hypothetical protein